MDGRRSYLESLNVGRQRRAQNTLDELTRSLEKLGERLERRDEPHGGGREHQPARPAADFRSPPGERRATRDAIAAQPPREDAPLATAGRLAAEVKGLRDELRQQMTSGLRQEFDALRGELARAQGAAGDARSSSELAGELERLSESIEMLAARRDDRSINLLRLDVEQLKAELETLAREETLRSMDSRWDQFDRRWHDLEQRIDTRASVDPALAMLNDRLQQISDAVNGLPESLSLKSLEERVRGLAGSVERFAGQRDDRSPESLAAIEQRLDEISRAIVASASAAQPSPLDYETVERIEGRISALARQLDDMARRGPSAEILDRLNLLSSRIEEVAQQADMPARSVERLAGQIAVIVDKLDAGSALPDADEVMRGLETRFDQFARQLERRQDDALESSQAMFRDLEARLFDVVSRLDTRPDPAADTAGIMDAIDARFADLSARLDRRDAAGLDRATVRELEAKIDTISDRIDRAPPVSAIDPDAIRNLESQVAGLSALLARPAAPDAIRPRLDEMEQAIRGNRDAVIAAARHAAEDVVRSFAGSGTDNAAVVGLTQDLKTLEALTRRSDDRNAKTFEAIHDTLLKIVDRLGAIETGAGPAKIAIKDAPPIQAEVVPAAETVAAQPRRGQPGPGREAPAEAVRAEALVEAPSAQEAPETSRRRSMFSGLGRALAGRKAEAPQAVPAAPAVEPAAPKLDLDEPLDPKALNRPLQPGSGAPDLSRILKRVREERSQQPAKPEEADAAKSDFIAAARRAAQAAAAEAEVLKRHSEIGGSSGGFKLAELLKARRKPILMAAAAIMIALAGLQLGKAFLSDDSPTVETASLAALPDAQGATDGRAAGDEAIAETAAADSPVAAAEAPTASVQAAADEPAAATTDPAPTPAPETLAAEPAVRDTEPTAAIAAAPAAPATPQPGQTPAATPIKAPADAGPTALREAAEGGDPKAMFEIGARYSEGRGTKADDAKAAQWYERAAELGLAPAQYRIGNMYEKGVGVARDLKKAKTWYQMAAEQGNASAMHNLAVLFAMGADGTTDNESAARWFARAAELGVKDSQFNMGILTAKGVGMPQNLEESYKWFALVAKAGDRDAATKRDEVANSLRPEQLERARATTELWKPKEVDAAANVVDVPEAWQEGEETTASIDMQKAVKTIQLILNKNGYDAGGADGIMGQKTKDAIAAFQKANGLPADGKVSEALVQKLLASK